MSETTMTRIGYGLSGLFVLFMLGASVAPKFLGLPVVEETMAALGWPAGYGLPIGILEFFLTLLYIYPRTNVLGAILFMGLLGGAMATQIRAGSPLFSHILFSIYLGLFMWGGLWLRDPALAGAISCQAVLKTPRHEGAAHSHVPSATTISGASQPVPSATTQLLPALSLNRTVQFPSTETKISITVLALTKPIAVCVSFRLPVSVFVIAARSPHS